MDRVLSVEYPIRYKGAYSVSPNYSNCIGALKRFERSKMRILEILGGGSRTC